MKTLQKIIIDEELTVEEFFNMRGLDSRLYFIAKNGQALQNQKELLKIGDSITLIPKLAGGQNVDWDQLSNYAMKGGDGSELAYFFRKLFGKETSVSIKDVLPEDFKLLGSMFNMRCASCNGVIHIPQNIVKLLGEEQTRKYLKFCKESNDTPRLLCCGCYKTKGEIGLT